MKDPAKIFAKVKSEEQLADVLLMLAIYLPNEFDGPGFVEKSVWKSLRALMPPAQRIDSVDSSTTV